MTKSLFFEDPEPKAAIRVCFRVDKKWPEEPVAVFLDTFPMDCYMHTGQHSVCEAEWCRSTKPAEDYADLLAELESIGYDVTVAKKMVYQDPQKIRCPKCGANFKPNASEYSACCADDNRNLRQGFVSGGEKLKRMSLKEWGLKNHMCKTKKK